MVGHAKEQDVFLEPEASSFRLEQEALDVEAPPSGRWGWGGTFTERSLPRQHLWTVRAALNWGLFKCGLGELLPLLVIFCFRGVPPYQILRLQSPSLIKLLLCRTIPGVAWQVLGRGRGIGGRGSRCCQVKVLAVAGDFAARTLSASGGSSRTSELNSFYPPNQKEPGLLCPSVGEAKGDCPAL